MSNLLELTKQAEALETTEEALEEAIAEVPKVEAEAPEVVAAREAVAAASKAFDEATDKAGMKLALEAEQKAEGELSSWLVWANQAKLEAARIALPHRISSLIEELRALGEHPDRLKRLVWQVTEVIPGTPPNGPLYSVRFGGTAKDSAGLGNGFKAESTVTRDANGIVETMSARDVVKAYASKERFAELEGTRRWVTRLYKEINEALPIPFRRVGAES